MTTGAPIYLVSACASGEEFVAAFRRYADKNGLFVPIAAPIPAGRRGRFAVTLSDGGVMIEGNAEIVSSASTPSVLHGRVGMTLRFVEPDIKSKTVLVELEQARLAMKPQPPSVPPRPAQIPAQPRPVVPAPAGRIDANNARAECVAIGDAGSLEVTTPQPKAGPKFVVPSIPPVAGAQRPKSPSTPPTAFPALPKPASTTAPGVTRSATPSTPPPLASRPPPAVPPPTTSPGVGVAKSAQPQVTPESITAVSTPITPGSITAVAEPLITPTHIGVPKAPSITEGWAAEDPPETDDPLADAPRDTVAMPAVDVIASLPHREGELVPVPQAREAEVFSAVRPKNDSDTFPVTVPPTPAKPADAVPEPVAASTSGSISKPNGERSNKSVLPPPRRTSNTSPPLPRNPTPAGAVPVLPLPRQATPSSAMPAVAKPAVGRATRIGFPIVEPKSPGQPSGQIPLPPIVGDASPVAPEAHDEPTDVSTVPIVVDDVEASVPRPSPAPAVPGGQRKTVMGVAVVPDGVTVLPASASGSIAMPSEKDRDTALMDAKASSEQTPIARPPVIEEPSGDWTMVPGDDGLTILPRKPEAAKPEVVVEDPTPIAPEPKPGDDKRLPTGDWTIARVEDSPDGWSEPSKVAARANVRPHTGPPIEMIVGEKSVQNTMSAKAFDIEEETKSGIKIEVDASLPIDRPTGSVDVSLASTQFATPPVPAGVVLTPVPGTLQSPMVQPPAQPMPMPMQPQMQPIQPMGIAPMQPAPMQPSPQLFAGLPNAASSGSFAHLAQHPRADSHLETVRVRPGETTAIINRRRRMLIIAASAGVVVIGIVAMVVAMSGSDGKKSKANTATTNLPADAIAVMPPPVVDAAVAQDPPDEAPPDASSVGVQPEQPPPPSSECVVSVASTPAGADVVLDKEVIGTTPAKVTLPCGVEARLVVRKNRYSTVARTVTPVAEGSKLKVTLGKTMLSVKVTSSPPGATIMLGGKSLGVTPGVVKLPGFESSTLVISKPGFNPDTQRFTPRQNNQSVHVSLKKKGR